MDHFRNFKMTLEHQNTNRIWWMTLVSGTEGHDQWNPTSIRRRLERLLRRRVVVNMWNQSGPDKWGSVKIGCVLLARGACCLCASVSFFGLRRVSERSQSCRSTRLHLTGRSQIMSLLLLLSGRDGHLFW